jgi:hypothetical protein
VVFDLRRANEALSGSAVLGRRGEDGREVEVDDRGNVGVRPGVAGMLEKRETSEATGGLPLPIASSSWACSTFSVRGCRPRDRKGTFCAHVSMVIEESSNEHGIQWNEDL